MARPKMPPGQRMTINLGLRVADEDVRRLEALAARIRGMTKHATARVALRLGLDVLEENPAAIYMKPEELPGAEKAPPKKRR